MKDKRVYDLVNQEEKRQREGIELIPSENYASTQVRAVLSSHFINKYSEGYPGRRYYGGNVNVDKVERLAQERAKKLFNVPHANVQPYSGSPANLAVYLATCKPGDAIMGQALTAGGHLTHGHKVSATGIFYQSIQYSLKTQSPAPKKSGLNTKATSDAVKSQKEQDNNLTMKQFNNETNNKDLFDYDEILRLAKKHKPKLIWVGATAYPLKFNYQAFSKIADQVKAYLAADIAHVAGLIAGQVHPTPSPYVDIVTTTTHKTLRGPRGAMIMVTKKGLKKDPDLGAKIDKAVFPGLQGGPHDNQTAAIAVCLHEASQPAFKAYAKKVVDNAKVLAKTLIDGGLTLIGGGTENHLILADLTPTLGIGTGIFAEYALDLVGLTLNKNTVPGEPSSPFYPSGVRLGSPAATTRGMGVNEMKFIGKTILKVIELLKPYRLPKIKKERAEYVKKFKKEIERKEKIRKLREEVKKVALRFPIP